MLFIISSLIVLIIKPKLNNSKTDSSVISYVGESNSVTIESLVAVSDKFGRTIEDDHSGAFGYLEFDVKNSSSEKQDFQIYITTNTSNAVEINSDYTFKKAFCSIFKILSFLF